MPTAVNETHQDPNSGIIPPQNTGDNPEHGTISLEDTARILELTLAEVERLVGIGRIPVTESSGRTRVPAGTFEWGSRELRQARVDYRAVLGFRLPALSFRLPARPALLRR
jgi:hypothetical protein